MRPVTLADLQVPRHAGPIADGKRNRWQRIKTNTRNRLERNGFPANDYATHAPHYAEKAKLRQLFETWKPLEHVFLWEVAYQNTYAESAEQHVGGWLTRTRKQHSEDWYRNTRPILNVCADGWGHTIRNAMVDIFPNEHTGEVGMKPIEAIKIEPIKTEAHVMLIHSAYDNIDTSTYRLSVSHQTCLPSLTKQTSRVRLHVCLCSTDPLLSERQAAFESTGHECRWIFRDSAITEETLYSTDWEIPDGRTLVSRMDDDDILPIDFCELTRGYADITPFEMAVLDWPNGYIWHFGKLHRFSNPFNQFISLLSDSGRHPHERSHKQFEGAVPRVVVDNSRGWVWVRHLETITGTREKYLRATSGEPNLKRWPVDITVQGLMQPCT